MSAAEANHVGFGGVRGEAPIPPTNGKSSVNHRVQEVRLQQGVSVRSASRKLGISMQEVRDQEDPACNLTISQLQAWQEVLEVPLADLLVDSDAPLSIPVYHRAQLLRVMKTAKAIDDLAEDATMCRFSAMLIEQLVALMPELSEVTPWHSVGQRRTQEEMGRIVERTLPDSFFTDRS